jgi:processive 1,2-diacylglycerol beta-glucosyltransferase
MSERLRVHVVYEYGTDQKPFVCSYVRLIRPLTHPTVASFFDTTFGIDLPEKPVDILILDRLWRPDVSLDLAADLVSRIRKMGARFLYHLDDNLLDLKVSRKRIYPPVNFVSIAAYFLSQADGVLVSTPALRERLLPYHANIQVVPNALDERLFSIDSRTIDLHPQNPDKIKIGYMGTFTHDADLKLILPALKRIVQKYRDRVQFEILGVIGNRKTLWKLKGLPLQFVSPKIEDIEYVRFLPWFTANIRWDIAIAPLLDTTFTRSKSDIKFLDYAAIGAAGVFSQGPVYSPTVEHLKTGWLAENRKKSWIEALETLIEDNTLRRELVHNASQYLYGERILAKRAKDWQKAIGQFI